MILFGRKTLRDRVSRAVEEQLAQSAQIPGYDFELCVIATRQRVQRMYFQAGREAPPEANEAVTLALWPHA